VFPRARGFWRGLADEMTRVSVSGCVFLSMRAEPRETSDRELCFVFVPPTNSIEDGGGGGGGGGATAGMDRVCCCGLFRGQ
jgi:hypothetical protein